MISASWRWLGRVPFAEVAREQERLREAILRGDGAETLLLCEHEPVVTLGRSARAEHVLASPAELAGRGVTVVAASRGGEVTYHGPGQLVGYPIVRLRGGVIGHVTAMARALAAVLADLGIAAVWRRETPGLFVGDAKLCAFGVHVRRRVTSHGFALNVGLDLGGFDLIVPCGRAGARTTSIARLLGPRVTVPALHLLASRAASALGHELGLRLLPDVQRAASHPADGKPIEMSYGITRMIGA